MLKKSFKHGNKEKDICLSPYISAFKLKTTKHTPPQLCFFVVDFLLTYC